MVGRGREPLHKPKSTPDAVVWRGGEHSYKHESVGGGGGKPLYKPKSTPDTVVWKGREPLIVQA